jgi:diguanylate cyclase (GGDEF)-like protein/PAS domain S-box-containing protein
LWGALIVFAVGGILLLVYALWSVYVEVRDEAEARAKGYAELLEVRFEATLRRVDADLAQLADRIPLAALGQGFEPGAAVLLQHDLEQFRLGFPEVAGFRVANAEGEVLFSAPGGRPANISDRAYFLALRDRPGLVTFFSDVVVSRLSNQPSVVAARAIRDSDGRFLGVVVAPLEIRYFERMFDSLRLGPGGALAIRRIDNHALVLRTPRLPEQVNQAMGDSHPVAERLAAGSRVGTHEFVSGADGERRIYAYRTLDGYPFYVLAGVAERDIRATWLQRGATLAGVSLLFLFGLAIVLFRLYRAQQRISRAAAQSLSQQAQLETAQRIAQMGSWELDFASRRVICSDELLRIFETERAGELGYDDFLARVHPDERSRMEKLFQEAVAGHQALQLRHRLLMPDGRVKNVLVSGETHYDEAGKPIKVIGTTQDITGLSRMESRMQLLASAFEHGGEAILITDQENMIVTVNPAFTRLTGYSAEESVGQNPRFLSAGRTTQEEYGEMWLAIQERGFWQGEIWDRRKDGGIYPKWMSVSVIRDEQGEICYHVAHFTDVSAERAAEAQLQHIAHHDMLTGLLNRLSLSGRLEQALAATRREGGRLAVLFIDLDRFKVINDTLGHHVGDELLIEVAHRLRESVRDSDVVARLGGDEFVVVLTGMEHSGTAAMIAEKLVRNIGDSYQIEGYDLYTTPSIGIAIFPIDGEDGETLMKNADAAMYHAKAAGRNNFQFFDSRMNDAAVERLNIEHSLRQALARDEFLLHFQPIIDMASGRVDGVEALVRWLHPEKGMIPPGRFIGIAEETGLIQPLGEWVFWAACRQLAEFNAAGLRGLKMGINISAMQLRNGNLPVLARGAIEAFGLEPATLVFEITESVAMHQPEETVRILDLLHDMGVGLAIDDFGTGYSSLSYLRMFPINHLKLDRSFVLEIGQGPDSAAICDATIGLAHSLGMKLVAEGVETEDQLAYLQNRGCDLVQGFFYSRPLPVDEVLAFIRQRNG